MLRKGSWADWNKAIRKLPYIIPAVSESGTRRNGVRFEAECYLIRSVSVRLSGGMQRARILPMWQFSIRGRDRGGPLLGPIELRPRLGKIADPSDPRFLVLFPSSPQLVFNDDPKSRCVTWVWRSLKDISRRIIMIVNKRLRKKMREF